MKFNNAHNSHLPTSVAPARERGLKYKGDSIIYFDNGRSRKGAWIEIDDVNGFRHAVAGRSRKGAWIEINIIHDYHEDFVCRSRKGAWIEMA